MFGVVALMPYPEDTRAMLRLAILTLPLFTAYSVAGALLRAYERMQYLLYAEVLSSATQLVLAITVLSRAENVMALAVIRIGGLALAAVLVVVVVWRMRLVGRPALDIRFSGALLRESADFFGMAAFDAVLQRMDVLILSVIAGEAVVGIYDAAFQLVKVVMTLVMSFTEAAYPVLSRLYVHGRERFSLATGKALQYGLIGLLPLATGATVLAPSIIGFLYRRAGYAPAANVLAVLSWGLLAYFVQMLLTRVLIAGNRPRASLWVTGVMVVSGVGLMAGLTWLFGAVGTAFGLGLTYSLGALLAWFATRDFSLSFGAGCLAKPALAATMMGVGLYFLPGLPIWGAIPAGVLVYAGLAWGLGVFDRGDMQILQALVRR